MIFSFFFIVSSNYKNSMYPRSFLCEEAKIKQRTPSKKELCKIGEEAIWECRFTSFLHGKFVLKFEFWGAFTFAIAFTAVKHFRFGQKYWKFSWLYKNVIKSWNSTIWNKISVDFNLETCTRVLHGKNLFLKNYRIVLKLRI